MKLFTLIALGLSVLSFNAAAENPYKEGTQEWWDYEDAQEYEGGWEDVPAYAFTRIEGRNVYRTATFCSALCPRDSEAYWAANELVDYMRKHHYRDLNLVGPGSDGKMWVTRWEDAWAKNDAYKMRKIEEDLLRADYIDLMFDMYDRTIERPTVYGTTVENTFEPAPQQKVIDQTVTIKK